MATIEAYEESDNQLSGMTGSGSIYKGDWWVSRDNGITMQSQVPQNIFRQPLTLVDLEKEENSVYQSLARFRASSVVIFRQSPGHAPPTPYINNYLYYIIL